MYQVHEYYHPHGLSGTNVRGVSDYRKKADAIAACKAHPTHATVTKAFTTETIFDNGKRAGVERLLGAHHMSCICMDCVGSDRHP